MFVVIVMACKCRHSCLYLYYPVFMCWSINWEQMTNMKEIIMSKPEIISDIAKWLLSGEVKVQGSVPLLSLKGHTTWIPRSLGIIPWPCDISLAVLYCLSKLSLFMSLSMRNLVRIIVWHVEFVKELVDKTWHRVQTIVGMLCVPLCHLSLGIPPVHLAVLAGLYAP